MLNSGKIITIAIAPAWDITCKAHGLNWNQHKTIDSQTQIPAGKALNISKALAEMHTPSIAAGLWAKADYAKLCQAIAPQSDYVTLKMTKTPGQTRQNITIHDTLKNREMHLRNKSKLATTQTMESLAEDLKKITKQNSTCIFAGAMPTGKLLTQLLNIINDLAEVGADIIVDTSGASLKRIATNTKLKIISPNLEELREISSTKIGNTDAQIINAARPLCKNTEMVLLSRGKKGAMAITKDSAFSAQPILPSKSPTVTVGCGDYLLAAMVASLKKGNTIEASLKYAVKTATAKALGKPASKIKIQQKQI